VILPSFVILPCACEDGVNVVGLSVIPDQATASAVPAVAGLPIETV